ncbi:Metallo-dependent phosphatase-like protein [Abortiporus biennis]|nr:Metallo-dependent phosphatase-like protein [Abortiporus biennis]
MRKLQGRFLHVTDMHPDPHYRPGMSEDSACHRKKPKKTKRRSGDYGMPYSDCDSPVSLTNYTLDFLDKKWSSDIDFVIWTGDSARHDNDRKLPRTTKEIYELNRMMTSKMENAFLKKGIPVIPSIGNNDIWPHNIMMPGPNDITFEYSSIWSSFVPFHSFQVFQRGGYYSVEVIPDALAVISLNTMYFFDSNKAVGGCEARDPQDPGNLQFDWLEVQLETFRNRGMQVWISGHVPPSAHNYYPECHIRYVELSLMFQDTILGHLFGHMNADHFFFLDAQVVANSNLNRSSDEPNGLLKKKHSELYDGLLKDFAHMEKRSKKIDHDNFAVVNVAPSVVPNPYLPSFRIFSYNITGTPYIPDLHSDRSAGLSKDVPRYHLGDSEVHSDLCRDSGFSNKSWLCQPSKPWKSNPNSPSRTNTLFTPLGFAQYFMPNLTTTKKSPPKYKLEYMTFSPASLHASAGLEEEMSGNVRYPIPLRHLPRSLRNSTVTKSKYAPYEMRDLTIPSWTDLARRLAKPKHEKLRKTFRKFMYMGAEER